MSALNAPNYWPILRFKLLSLCRAVMAWMIASRMGQTTLWAQSYQLNDLGPTSSTSSYAMGVNNSSRVAGYGMGNSAAFGFLYDLQTSQWTNVSVVGASNTFVVTVWKARDRRIANRFHIKLHDSYID